MADLAFTFDWEDPGGARGAELGATWARLHIAVGDEVVTRLIDGRSRGVRDAVYLPLYPLAEWLATHWWPLLHEPEAPGRSTTATYDSRHNLRHAAEGFALPQLHVVPTGESVLLRWDRAARPMQRVEFTASGTRLAPAASVCAALATFVDAVVHRLDERGVRGTLLQDEWPHVRNADPDERVFCATAGSLGLDPYSLDEAEGAAVVAAYQDVPYALRAAFFENADPAILDRQVAAVLTALHAARAPQHDRRFLYQLREEVRAHLGEQDRGSEERVSEAPWVAGHALARRVREVLEIGDDALPGADALARRLGADDPQALRPDRVQRTESGTPFDALMAVNAERGPGFVLTARGAQPQRFALCRALYEFLTTPTDEPRLVTRARTTAQQRNRAFAAEFLAPVDALRRRLKGPDLFDEHADELASEFGVSPLVVQYQLENHGIARLRSGGSRLLAR